MNYFLLKFKNNVICNYNFLVFEIKMTEEIEAHVLKKYEILQKLGKDY